MGFSYVSYGSDVCLETERSDPNPRLGGYFNVGMKQTRASIVRTLDNPNKVTTICEILVDAFISTVAMGHTSYDNDYGHDHMRND